MKYALTNGVILDGSRNMEPVYGKAVVFENGKIVDITNDQQAISTCNEIDLKGRYLLPGLINMHVHLAGNGGNGKPQRPRDNAGLVRKIFSNPVSAAVAHRLAAGYARTELMSGVTTIRTVGGLKDLDTKIRDEISSGRRTGPRILAANEGISVPGGHMAGSVAVSCHSIAEALEQVEHCRAVGTDLVKLMITGGVMDAVEKGAPGELKMAPEMIQAVCEKAHAYGFYVAAHTESPLGVKTALENGVDSIEHGAEPDEEIIQLFKKKGAFLTTTLSPALPYAFFDREVSGATEVQRFNGQVVFDGIRDMAIAAVKNDIPVCLGNDVGCPWITQYDFWRELVYFQKYVGVSAAFAIYSATLRAAQLAGIGSETGSIEIGKDADLIAVEKNPLENLNALRDVSLVIARGRVFNDPSVKRKAAIDRMLDPYCE